jgi:menaquinone-specific isochorismate synthase
MRNGDVLEALHPTPAVGGTPRLKAIELIRTLEPFDRGWYSGPVGWLGPYSSEFAVGIRSGLIHGNRLSLFAGAGIVAGSTIEGEWREIEQKSAGLLSTLGLS